MIIFGRYIDVVIWDGRTSSVQFVLHKELRTVSSDGDEYRI